MGVADVTGLPDVGMLKPRVSDSFTGLVVNGVAKAGAAAILTTVGTHQGQLEVLGEALLDFSDPAD